MRLIAVLFFFLACAACQATVGLQQIGGGNKGGSAPVVQSATFTISSPVSNGGAVGTATATNSPTSWTITAGDAAGNFAIDSSGHVTTTANGVSNITGDVFSVTLTLQASNSSGNGTGNNGVTAYADGLPGAPVSGNIQHATFFSAYALQSSQTYTTRPPWRVAGVDYAVGIPLASFPLKDPVSSPPTGCSVAGSPKVVTCTGASPTVDGYDFSSSGAQTCVQLVFNSSTTGTITVKNSNFKYDSSGCNTSESLIIVNATGTTVNLLLQNNVIDGNANNFPTSCVNGATVYSQAHGTFSDQYNAYLHSAQSSVIQAPTSNNYTSRWNYGEGWVYSATCAHAAWDNVQWGGTMPAYVKSFNTALQPLTPQSGVTALLELATFQAGAVVTSASITYNTIVMNTLSGGGVNLSEGIAVDGNAGNTVYTTLNITDNYFDPTGALQCYAKTTSPTITTLNFVRNVDLKDSSTVNNPPPACFGVHP